MDGTKLMTENGDFLYRLACCPFEMVKKSHAYMRVNKIDVFENAFLVIFVFKYKRLSLWIGPEPLTSFAKVRQEQTSLSSSLMWLSFSRSEDSRAFALLTSSCRFLHSAKAFCSFSVHSVILVSKDLILDCIEDTCERKYETLILSVWTSELAWIGFLEDIPYYTLFWRHFNFAI